MTEAPILLEETELLAHESRGQDRKSAAGPISAEARTNRCFLIAHQELLAHGGRGSSACQLHLLVRPHLPRCLRVGTPNRGSRRGSTRNNRTSQRAVQARVHQPDSRRAANNRDRRSAPLRESQAEPYSAHLSSSHYNESHHST